MESLGNKNFDVPDELSLQNLTKETRLKVESEREDRKCTFVKFQIETLKKEYLNGEDINENLRKTLVETETEINQIRQEIVKQKETIKNVCYDDRLKNFSDVFGVVSQVTDEYDQFKSLLVSDIQKCNSYYAEIDLVKNDITKLSDLVTHSKKEQENIVNQVESKTIKMKNYLDAVSDEKVALMENEFAKCKGLKNELQTLEVQKKSAEDKWKETMENNKKIKEDISNMSTRYDELNRYFEELKSFRAENHAVTNDLKILENADADKYNQVRLKLNNLKYEIHNLEKYNESLKSQKNELEKHIALQYQQIKIWEREIQFTEDMKGASKTKGKTEENILNMLRRNISDVKNNSRTFEEKISALEAEFESYSHLTNEETVEIETSWDKLQRELENSNRELDSFKNEESYMRGVIEKLLAVEEQRVSELQTYRSFIEKLEHINREAVKNLSPQIDEVNEQFSAHRVEIDALAVDKYEKELLLDTLREDLSIYKKAVVEKQFEMWTLSRENEAKSVEHEELIKKIKKEVSNRDMSENLLANLEKNSIPVEEIRDSSLYQSYEKEKEAVEALRQERKNIKREKELLRQKLQKFEYEKFKTSRVSQSMSDLNISDVDIEKKSNKDRMKKKN